MSFLPSPDLPRTANVRWNARRQEMIICEVTGSTARRPGRWPTKERRCRSSALAFTSLLRSTRHHLPPSPDLRCLRFPSFSHLQRDSRKQDRSRDSHESDIRKITEAGAPLGCWRIRCGGVTFLAGDEPSVAVPWQMRSESLIATGDADQTRSSASIEGSLGKTESGRPGWGSRAR